MIVRGAGVGFDPQVVDRLFKPFTTTKSGSMGISLSVSRPIIESHHGRLWATPNDGPGAMFSFSIPCAPAGVTGTGVPGASRAPDVTDAQHTVRNS